MTKARRLKVKTKQCDRKESVTVTPFALQSNCVGDGAIYSRVPGCCERKWAADRAVTDHGDLTVKLTADTLRLQMNQVRTKRNFGTEKEFRNRWTENFPDENVLPPTARVSAEARDENE